MDMEKIQNKTTSPALADDFLEEFDFKPITSGLGFHHEKVNEMKAAFPEKQVVVRSRPVASVSRKKEMNVYENDLSLFYNQGQPIQEEIPSLPVAEEKVYRVATKPQRIFAYISDLLFINSILGIVLTVMARTISMDLLDVWRQFPHEITPLVVSLFCGFYMIYFSIFEKTAQSTLGKSLFNLRVVGEDHKSLSLTHLILRSAVGLLNFASLGLFSYFDLQNKITHSKVIRVD